MNHPGTAAPSKRIRIFFVRKTPDLHGRGTRSRSDQTEFHNEDNAQCGHGERGEAPRGAASARIVRACEMRCDRRGRRASRESHNATLVPAVVRAVVAVSWVFVAVAVAATPAAAGPVPYTVSSSVRTQTVDVHLPSDFDEKKSYPLVVLLHGRQDSGFVRDPSNASAQVAMTFDMKSVADDLQLIYVAPQAYHQGGRAWCASPSCCCGPGTGEAGVYDLSGWPSRSNFEGTTRRCGRDGRLPCRDDAELDSDFLRDVIASVSQAFPVDRDRVFAVGISNGGYMAWRLACDHSDLIAGIISICGASVLNVEEVCRGASPVHVLHVHGAEDAIVPFAPLPGSLAGARADVRNWARAFNGCRGDLDDRSEYTRAPPDHSWGSLVSRVSVERYLDCDAEAELWTIPSGRGSGTLACCTADVCVCVSG